MVIKNLDIFGLVFYNQSMVIKNQKTIFCRGEVKLANQNFNKVYETISNSIASLHGYLHLTFRTIFAAAYALLQISEFV